MHLLASRFVLQVLIDGPNKGKEEKKEMSVCFLSAVGCCVVLIDAASRAQVTASDWARKGRSIRERESTLCRNSRY